MGEDRNRWLERLRQYFELGMEIGQMVCAKESGRFEWQLSEGRTAALRGNLFVS